MKKTHMVPHSSPHTPNRKLKTETGTNSFHALNHDSNYIVNICEFMQWPGRHHPSAFGGLPSVLPSPSLSPSHSQAPAIVTFHATRQLNRFVVSESVWGVVGVQSHRGMCVMSAVCVREWAILPGEKKTQSHESMSVGFFMNGT